MENLSNLNPQNFSVLNGLETDPLALNVLVSSPLALANLPLEQNTEFTYVIDELVSVSPNRFDLSLTEGVFPVDYFSMAIPERSLTEITDIDAFVGGADWLVGSIDPSLRKINTFVGMDFEGDIFLNGTGSQIVTTEIVLVDSSVENYEALIADLPSRVEVFVLDSQQDGIQQISDILANHQDVSSLHLITHGNEGFVQLGSTELTGESLARYNNQIAQWGSSLTATADILLYGCRIGAGTVGASFVEQLGTLTGADVAASDDLTGSSLLGGDAELEYRKGSIESLPVLSKQALDNYGGVLLLGSPSTNNDDTFTFEQSDWGATLGNINGLSGFDILSFTNLSTALSFSISESSSGVLEIVVADQTNSANTANIQTTSIEKIIGSQGNDTFTFNNIGDINNLFTLGDGVLEIDGDAGTDTINFAENVYLNGDNLFLSAETINVPETTTIVTTGDVTLSAIASSNINQISDLKPVELTANITVDGTIEAGKVKLEADINNDLILDGLATSFQVNSTSKATAIIGSTATIKADNLEVIAETETNFNVQVTDATVESVSLGGNIHTNSNANFALLQEDNLGDGSVNFYLWDADNANEFNSTNPTYVVTHGWQSDIKSSPNYDQLFQSIQDKEGGNVNILFVDWSDLAGNINYPTAANDTLRVGNALGNFLVNLTGLNPSTTTLIGSSLGAHVSGNAGAKYQELTENSLNLIIGLDPAGPEFEGALGRGEAERLNSSDATRVVAIHTSDILGYDDPLGDLDLYVNPDSLLQPEAYSFVDNHAYGFTLLGRLLEGESLEQTDPGFTDGSLDYADISDTNLSGSINVTTNIKPISITTYAGIDGGATINVGVISDPNSISVTATDNTNIQTKITTDTNISEIIGFDAVQSNITLARDTKAYIGDSLVATTVVDKDGISATGGVEVLATATGDITSTIDSDFLGVHSTSVTQDDVIANVTNVNLQAKTLEVEAINDSSYTAEAKIASNAVVGDTKAYITDSTVSADPGANGEAITVLATDNSSYTVRSRDLQQTNLDLSSLTKVEIGKASATNKIIKNTQAYVSESSSLTAINGNITINASNSQAISAEADAMAITDFGLLGTLTNLSSLSLGGTFALNEISGDVSAYVLDSSITAANGNLGVNASNSSSIDATSSATAKAQGGSNSTGAFTFAFNSIGKPSPTALLSIAPDSAFSLGNLLGKTFETLTGIELGSDGELIGADTTAYIKNTKINSGDITVTADGAQQINATVSNVSDSTGQALINSNGVGIGGIVASNQVTSASLAFIEDALDADGKKLEATGNLTVKATDRAGIFSNSKIVTSQVTTNTGGIDVLNDGTAALIPLFGNPTYTTASLTPGNSRKTLNFGDTVSLSMNFDKSLGESGRTYTYLGGNGYTADLLTENYNNLDLWKELLATQIQNDGMNLSSSNSVAIGGMVVRNEVDGGATAYIKNTDIGANTVNVTASEEAVIQAVADATAQSSGGSAFGAGESITGNGTIAVNSVLSDAIAYIEDSQVITTGDIEVKAENTAQLGAETKSAINTGADAYGAVLAFNTIGYQSQNLLYDTLDALFGLAPNEFDYETTDTPDLLQENDRVKVGDIIYRYEGGDIANPDLSNNAQSYTNSLLWIPVLSVFGNEEPAKVEAYIRNSDISADGNLTVTANSLAQIEARTSNSATAAASALFGANAMTMSGVLASNKVSSETTAFIDSAENATDTVDIKVAGNLTISAVDDAAIDATTNMVAAASKKNDLGLGIINDLFNTLTGDYQYTTNSGTKALEFGDKVRLDDVDATTKNAPSVITQGDWIELSSDVGNGKKGQIYEYLGNTEINGTSTLRRK